MTKPAYHAHEEFQNRSRKLQEIRTLGIDPYPATYRETHTISSVLEAGEKTTLGSSEEGEKGNAPHFAIAGRLVLFRAMGKNSFAHLQDETGRIQILCNRDVTQAEGFLPTPDLSPLKFIEKKLDLGDIVGVEGYLFRTQKGEITLYVHSLKLLTKSLLPLPDKHGGMADKGMRYRKRWLDLITNEASLATFRLRSKILFSIRSFFAKEGFEEVETPVLQNVYGGAAARPFTTHLNALHLDMFLRISLEIPLKKLIVGGLPKIFEMGKVFRNEGIDATHNPEFTMLEAYAAGWDYHDTMRCTETLFETLALELFGDTKLRVSLDEGTVHVIDLQAPWKRLSMEDAVREYGNIDTASLSLEEMREHLAFLEDPSLQTASRGTLLAKLFETFAEKHLIQPHHIIDHPIETTPLCKPHRDPRLRERGFVERFESFLLGREMANSYTELNDPELQRTLLEEQAAKREQGDLEASPLDEEFLEAICQGMPPTGGVGIGIDRLVMLFANAASIRDVLFFPIVRPENEEASILG